jgi:hypothetical protein
MDQTIHRWEHNMVLSSERLVHQEAFWPIMIVALMILVMILATIFSKGAMPAQPRFYPGPFGTMY